MVNLANEVKSTGTMHNKKVDLPPVSSMVEIVGGKYGGHVGMVERYTPMMVEVRLFPALAHTGARKTLNPVVMIPQYNIRLRKGVSPMPYLPTSLRGKQPACLSNTIAKNLGKNAKSPACPHVKASFEWYDYNHGPRPKRVKIKVHRFLLSSLATKKDVKHAWLSASCLEVSIRYPDIMNYAVELLDLVTDDESNPVFHENHPCTKGFEKDLESRREHDGYCYETFKIDFEMDQDPQFLQINDKLNGFDVLRGKYLNSKDKLCHLLQDTANHNEREG
jgi:hypothetical protein